MEGLLVLVNNPAAIQYVCPVQSYSISEDDIEKAKRAAEWISSMKEYRSNHSDEES
jgi:hypothetical protein